MASSLPSVAVSPSRAKRRRPRRRKVYGCTTPRIYTPPLRELEPRSPETEQRTLGYAVIDFAEQMLGLDLLPWQRWLLVHMLELLPDYSLRFRTVVVLVARQNGKSTLSQVVSLWFMYCYGVRLVLGTAQDLDTAEDVWEGAVDLVHETDDDDEPLRPELVELVERIVKVNGKKAMVLKPGSGKKRRRYKVKAANRRAGRGLSGDVVMLDELREHQTWDSWGALTKTTMARAMALILALSNAGDWTSVVLRHLRLRGHAALGDPDGINAADPTAEQPPDPGDVAAELDEDDDDYLDEFDDELGEEFDPDELEELLAAQADSLAIFEWSAPPDCDRRDRDGWAQANPALGYGRGEMDLTEKAIAAACNDDPEWVFRTEVLCQWAPGTLKGPFPGGSWLESLDQRSMPVRQRGVKLCVAMSHDRSVSHIGLAGWRPDGHAHVEIIASRVGSDWVVPWLTDPERSESIKAAPVVVRATTGAPEASLIEPLEAAGVTVIEWKGADVPKGCGGFYDRVRAAIGEGPIDDEPEASEGSEGSQDGRDGEDTPSRPLKQLRHRTQPVLDIAAATAATRPVGDGWVWDLRGSSADASPLFAVTGATWELDKQTAPKPPPATPQVADGGKSETAGLTTAGF